jgi:hypothetical protein
MKFKLFFAFFSIFIASSTAQIASCEFEHLYVESYVYGCGLTLYNPLFLEVDELLGDHSEEDEILSDADVIGISHYNGSIGFFPSVICERLFNVERIDLHESGLRAVLDDSFSNCGELTWLQLSNNRINSISNDAFATNLKLAHLDLTNATLTTIASGIFDNLAVLETLILQDNELGDIFDGIFGNLIELTILNLQNTGITKIDSWWFSTNDNLIDVILSRNKITKISRENFQFFTSVQHLDLNGNKIGSFASDTLHDLTSLITIDISSNLIAKLADGTFNEKPALQILDLNHNQIDDLPIGIFAPLVSMRYVRLSGNHLKVFRRSVFCEDLGNLTMIDVHENEIVAMDRRILEEAKGVDYFGFLDNVCASGSMYEFLNGELRPIYMEMLKGCFENFEWTVGERPEIFINYFYI